MMLWWWRFNLLVTGNELALINVVALRWSWLVLECMTVRGYTISVFNQATQAYSAWPSLRGSAQWAMAMVSAATAREETASSS